MGGRRSYKYLMSLPGWGLYDGERLVATIAAEDAYKARALFKRAELVGTEVRLLPKG